ncbi:MAG TPA: hypothetical protein VFG20_06580 [Planctomycetaceae bacterium]|nr:hypothetical protein [Planctomycetaceae bacterium]
MSQASPLPPSDDKSAEKLREELLAIYLQGEKIRERLGEINRDLAERGLAFDGTDPSTEATES